METKFKDYLNTSFAPYGHFPTRDDVFAELLANMQEKFADLKAEGLSDDEAFQKTVDSMGDVSEIMENVAHNPAVAPRESKVRSKRLSGTDLRESDFADADLTGSNFTGSALRGANFNNANLTDTVFKGSDTNGASFVGANLTGANFKGCDLANAALTAQTSQTQRCTVQTSAQFHWSRPT